MDEISVICSDNRKKALFAEFDHPPLPEERLPAAVTTGGAVGAVVGGLVGVAVAATGGVGLLAAGPIVLALGGGAVTGGFIGAMTTRGVTKEMADFYDQAVTRGKVLVAIEEDDDDSPRLALAENAFTRAGAEPLPLATG